MAKDNETKQTEGGAAPAPQTQTETKKRPPRMVDETIADRDPVVVIDVKEATIAAAAAFIAKALKAAQGEPYHGVTAKGSLKIFTEEAE